MRRVLRAVSFLAILTALITVARQVSVDIPAVHAQQDPTRPPAVVPTAPAAPTADNETRRAQVVARVGSVRITVGDIEDRLAGQSPYARTRYRDREELRELVAEMIRFELLAREAARQGFGEDREVREATAQSAVQLFIRERFDERITPESIPAADVSAYYTAHPEEFSRPEMRRASHILVATREEADTLVTQLRQGDARLFRSTAQERSLDSESRTRGGDLRYFDPEGRSTNSTDPAVEAALARAAFGLREAGDVSDPVALGDQWSIVMLTGRRPAEHRSETDAAPSIRLRIWRERRQEALESFVEDLRNRGAVEVHHDRADAIRIATPEQMTQEPGTDEEVEEATIGRPEGQMRGAASTPVVAPTEAEQRSPESH
jgi:peptidyl-prolyl cis-trans isomerase C